MHLQKLVVGGNNEQTRATVQENQQILNLSPWFQFYYEEVVETKNQEVSRRRPKMASQMDMTIILDPMKIK